MKSGHGDSLEVVALSDHEWRVCDRELDASDTRRILAYIEKCDGAYEVMSMKPKPCVCGRFRTFDDALSRVRAERRQTDVRRASTSERIKS